MKLSENFTLDELTVSQTAARAGFSNTPGQIEANNLKRLCEDVLQPLRDALNKSIHISSGYRCYALNSMVGGAKDSAHTHGCAADITVEGMTPYEVASAIIDLHLPFEQVIQEFGQWCHVSVPELGKLPKREVLTASKAFGKTIYNLGLDKP